MHLDSVQITMLATVVFLMLGIVTGYIPIMTGIRSTGYGPDSIISRPILLFIALAIAVVLLKEIVGSGMSGLASFWAGNHRPWAEQVESDRGRRPPWAGQVESDRGYHQDSEERPGETVRRPTMGGPNAAHQ